MGCLVSEQFVDRSPPLFKFWFTTRDGQRHFVSYIGCAEDGDKSSLSHGRDRLRDKLEEVKDDPEWADFVRDMSQVLSAMDDHIREHGDWPPAPAA